MLKKMPTMVEEMILLVLLSYANRDRLLTATEIQKQLNIKLAEKITDVEEFKNPTINLALKRMEEKQWVKSTTNRKGTKKTRFLITEAGKLQLAIVNQLRADLLSVSSS